ncbi:MAG: alpha-2-macroglobulin, partial [Sphingobacteriales bacterium]
EGLAISRQGNFYLIVCDMQSPNGGFVWFPGGPDDRYITQYIVTGLSHLLLLDPATGSNKDLQEIITAALKYLDQSVSADYEQLIKLTKKGAKVDGGLGNLQIQYLYLRSAFKNYPVPGSSLKAVSYYREQAQKSWIKQSRYMQAMIALALQRTDDIKTAKAIITALKQNAVISEEMGMYWKDVRSGYFWHQAPVETQAILIEAFAEINRDQQAVNDMKTWLLKQKQTQSWNSTRATAEACYALFITVPPAGADKAGSGIADLLQNNPDVSIKLGNTIVDAGASSNDRNDPSSQPEAGTGYFKRSFNQDQVKPAMGNIEVTLKAPGKPAGAGSTANLPSWGAVYWQYFENIDQVSSATAGALQVKKQLFVETQSDRGAVLRPITSESPLKVGDKLKVRIELRSDRDLEYVHMKDMRAAGTEPLNVISRYKWQDGLGYYESTGDAATNFYFSWLSKGVYVFEYPLRVTHSGNFS